MKSRFIAKESVIDRTVAHLKEEISSGRLRGPLAGSEKTAAALGVSRATVRAAMARLLEDGLLAKGGPRGAMVVREGVSGRRSGNRRLNIAILLVRPLEALGREIHLGLLRVSDEIRAAGHDCRFVNFPARYSPNKTGCLPALVASAPTDAWILFMPTREITVWFVDKKITCFAMGGVSEGFAVAAAGADLSPGVASIVLRLSALGHRRIVFVCPKIARTPGTDALFIAYNEALKKAGITPGEYNTPDWEETPEGLARLMDSLFRVTPPTAIIAFHTSIAQGVLSWLSQRNVAVPQRVSFVILREEEGFAWLFPELKPAKLKDGDAELYYRRVRRWVRNVSAGRRDVDQTRLPVTFEEGNTIGPPPKA